MLFAQRKGTQQFCPLGSHSSFLQEPHGVTSQKPSFYILDMINRMVSSGMLRRVALVRSDVSEELSASFIRVTEIDDWEQHSV
jgi:hypothetical protein